MTICSRRSLLSLFGFALPFGLRSRFKGVENSAIPAPLLRFRPFEEAVRAAFADRSADDQASLCRRVEIGHSDRFRIGLQGCYNDRGFAGFAAGQLKIVRAGSQPGPARNGVRLYVATVDIAFNSGLETEPSGQPLDFASILPAPVLA